MSAAAVGDFVDGAIAWTCFNQFHGAAKFLDERKRATAAATSALFLNSSKSNLKSF